ncbi:hypothetical protein G7059_07980 [Erysipelothrix sp. HDW6A]|uniref:hypothetical protein n=1 Tax=Erysipelothrix sp. HDW6A TaxID=2714928 RepID=UPI00140AB4AA|nr:hypothetical protein [Erysipelothrix sp. HDW6A]QIK57780.1 hypothetical protein G7059_07980 [Erysipelothrix sp. HDW6A]
MKSRKNSERRIFNSLEDDFVKILRGFVLAGIVVYFTDWLILGVVAFIIGATGVPFSKK